MSIGARIKEQRKLRKLTQPRLAELIGISLDMVKSMETDRSNPSVDTLNKLSNLFNVSADYLLGRETHVDYELSLIDKVIKEAEKQYGISLKNDPAVHKAVEELIKNLIQKKKDT